MKVVLVFLCLTGTLYCSTDSLQDGITELEKANIFWRNDFYGAVSTKAEKIILISAGSACLLWQAGIVDAAITATKKNKNGWFAALLSLIIPGAGQAYNGQYLKAAGSCCLTSFFTALSMAHPKDPPTYEYFPMRHEKEFFDRAKKYIYPLEVKNDLLAFSDSLLCWFGVIKSTEFCITDSTIIAKFSVEHKYYDYVLTMGMHLERLFLSPLGEGDFIYQTKEFVTTDTVTTKQNILKMACPGNLAICYGYPVNIAGTEELALKDGCIIFADEVWFSTEISSYTMCRNGKGKPVKENVKYIKTPKPGKND